MKRISLLLCFALLLSAGFAQKKGTAKAVIQTPGVQCENCKNRIERHLYKEDGMITSKADYRKHTVAVSFYTDRTNIENIKTSIANTGYDADDVTAEEGAYNRLPKPCQHVPLKKATE